MTWKWRREGDEHWLFYNQTTSDLAFIDERAFAIWQALSSGETVEELVERFAEEYAAPEEVIREDVLVTRRDLYALGLLAGPTFADTVVVQTDLVRTSAWGQGALSAPLRLFVTLTRTCPLECTHCYNASGPRVQEHIPEDRMMRLLQEASDMRVFEVILSGGEPLVYPAIANVLERTHDLALTISLVTSGMVTSNKVLTALHAHPPTRIQVSMEGHLDVHERIRGAGTYQRALRGAEILNTVAPVTIGLTLTPALTAKSFAALCDDLAQRGLRLVSVNRLLKSGRAVGMETTTLEPSKLIALSGERGVQCLIEEGEKTTARYHCAAGVSVLSIGADSRVYPCSYLQMLPDAACGDLKTATLSEVWRSVALERFRATNANFTGTTPCICDALLSRQSTEE